MNLSIKRSMLAEIYSGMSKILARGPHGLRMEISHGSLRASSVFKDEALIYEDSATDSQGGEVSLVIPNNVLKEIAACRDGDSMVRFQTGEDSSNIAEWTQGSLHFSRAFNAPENFPEMAIPPKETFNPINAQAFARHCAIAAQITAAEKTQLSIDCIALDGDDSRMIATDGKQLYIGESIAFPWKGVGLLPITGNIPEKILHASETMEAAMGDQTLAFKGGPWTVLEKIREPGFPPVESIIPHPGDTALLLELSESDARQLEECLPLMPGNESGARVIELSVENQILIKAESEGATASLILESSLALGGPLTKSFNRDYWLRALRMGLREFRIKSVGGPIASRAKDSLYLFMPVFVREETDNEESTSAGRKGKGGKPTRKPPIEKRRIHWLEKECAWRLAEYAVHLGVMERSGAESAAEGRLEQLRQTQEALRQARKDVRVEASEPPHPNEPPKSAFQWESVGRFNTADGGSLELLRSEDGYYSVRAGERIQLTCEHVASILEPLLIKEWRPFTLALYYNGCAWRVNGEHILERKGKSVKRRLLLSDGRPANPGHCEWEAGLLDSLLKDQGVVPGIAKYKARLDQLRAWQSAPPPPALDLLSLCLQFARTA